MLDCLDRITEATVELLLVQHVQNLLKSCWDRRAADVQTNMNGTGMVRCLWAV